MLPKIAPETLPIDLYLSFFLLNISSATSLVLSGLFLRYLLICFSLFPANLPPKIDPKPIPESEPKAIPMLDPIFEFLSSFSLYPLSLTTSTTFFFGGKLNYISVNFLNLTLFMFNNSFTFRRAIFQALTVLITCFFFRTELLYKIQVHHQQLHLKQHQ